jgi:DNA-binding IclR family transcriptional regulator
MRFLFHKMKPRDSSFSSGTYAIQALQRGMKVLDTLLDARSPLKLEDICAFTGLPKSTASRIVVNLLQSQYLVKTASQISRALGYSE